MSSMSFNSAHDASPTEVAGEIKNLKPICTRLTATIETAVLQTVKPICRRLQQFDEDNEVSCLIGALRLDGLPAIQRPKYARSLQAK